MDVTLVITGETVEEGAIEVVSAEMVLEVMVVDTRMVGVVVGAGGTFVGTVPVGVMFEGRVELEVVVGSLTERDVG